MCHNESKGEREMRFNSRPVRSEELNRYEVMIPAEREYTD